METNFNILKELLKKDRSIRRFNENKKIEKAILENLIDLTRYCASGRNLQPLRYYIINEKTECDKIFPLLKWAGFLIDWNGPHPGERPSAYIIQFLDTQLTRNPLCDEGLQIQAITLGATALNLGCCIIKSFDSKKLIEIVKVDESFVPCYIIAIGEPKEIVILEEMNDKENENYKYYRTEDGIHHVPKRKLKELLLN